MQAAYDPVPCAVPRRARDIQQHAITVNTDIHNEGNPSTRALQRTCQSLVILAAQNANWTGPADTTMVALGNAKPTAPQNLRLIQGTDGGVAFPVQQSNALPPTPSTTGTWTPR
ncbi:MAG: hypothetical protein ACKOW5_10820 [Actinomycetales bacterium]